MKLSTFWKNLFGGLAELERLECSSMGVSPEMVRPSGTMPLSKPQQTQMAKAIAYLKRTGSITTFDCNRVAGTVDARKMFTVMRKLGLLYPASNPKGYRWAPNTHNSGRHKVHLLVKGAK